MEYDLKESENKDVKQFLKRRLRSRGLTLLEDEPAESHGPHYPQMPNQVWICLAKDDETGDEGWVVLYPKAVYWIDSPDDWGNPDEDMRIWSS